MLEMTGSEPAGEEKTRVSTFIPFDFTPGEYSVVHAVVMPRAGVAALPTLIPLEEFGDERTIVIESE